MSVATRPQAAPPGAVPVPPPRSASLGALLRRGLRDHRRAPLTWGGSLGLLSALILFIWPSIEDSAAELVESYPEGLKEAFGIGELSTVEAYYEAEMLSLIIPLAVAFLAVRTMIRGVTGAEERRWLDTVLATPLPRQTLVAGSFAVTAVVVAAVLLVSLVLSLLAGVVSGSDPSVAVIGRGLANVWPLSMFFAGLAMLAAGRLRGTAPVTAVAVGTLVVMYLLDVVGRVADSVEALRWVSAFRYYGSAVQDGIDPLAFAGLTLVGAALAALGATLFARRDIAG